MFFKVTCQIQFFRKKNPTVVTTQFNFNTPNLNGYNQLTQIFIVLKKTGHFKNLHLFHRYRFLRKSKSTIKIAFVQGIK